MSETSIETCRGELQAGGHSLKESNSCHRQGIARLLNLELRRLIPTPRFRPEGSRSSSAQFAISQCEIMAEHDLTLGEPQFEKEHWPILTKTLVSAKNDGDRIPAPLPLLT
jgi:hypothetical protein